MFSVFGIKSVLRVGWSGKSEYAAAVCLLNIYIKNITLEECRKSRQTERFPLEISTSLHIMDRFYYNKQKSVFLSMLALSSHINTDKSLTERIIV